MRAQNANVKRDADIGVAEANRDDGIRVSRSPHILKQPQSASCFKSEVKTWQCTVNLLPEGLAAE